MIPLLFAAHYDPTTQQYPARLSLGRLSDALSCVVTESLDGCYQLEMTYPVDGIYTAQLMQPCTIAVLRPYADGNEFKRELAWFDVYSRTIENGIVTIYAYHISYRLGQVVCVRVPSAGYTIGGALDMIQRNIMPTNTYANIIRITSDSISLDPSNNFESSEVKSAREYLFDDTYSVRKFFNAEAVFHGIDLRFVQQRGEDRGVEIRYGKNLTGGTITKDETGISAGVYPYWKGNVDGLARTVLSDTVVYPTTSAGAVPVLAVDFSAYFQTEPSRAELKALAKQYLDENSPWLAKLTANISFSPEWYQQGGAIREIIDLGDTVTVFYGDADLAGEKMRVVQIKYNVLLEQFSEYTLGELQKQYAVTSRDGISATRQIMA